MQDINLTLNTITFGYQNSKNVFDNHNLDLSFNNKIKYNLYGIIGPSGTGKTTLVSIIGGQINPQKGDVLINKISIYKIDDNERRKLIAMQMQSSSSIRGTLEYNLRFGLPIHNKKPIYSDDELIDILKKVGLWELFKDKSGLKTLIGEGGLNLSGGQRQRLNFAGLYLRALYFKPKIILIDEPTSSLDEISEKAITQMILELSKTTLTLVVAHRLKTLDSAAGVLDTSMLKKVTKLKFYDKTELLQKSKYYRDLISGEAELGD
jgi:ATP-binding cassette, subfamily B, bacterial PglK